MASDVTSIEGRVDQHTLLKANMSHKSNVNTAKSDAQAKNAIVPTLQMTAIRQQLGDIESQAIAAQALGEICFEELDRVGERINDQVALTAILRLDALIKAVCRNVELMHEAVEQVGGLLLEGAPA